MKSNDYKALVSKSPFGFALHRILVNDYGQPVDYEFIDVNASFEALTGLKASKIINRRVTEVLPEIKTGNFSWIDFYGKVAIQGGEEIFEQYSEPLKKYYKVQVFSPIKEYFATFFVDISDQKLNEQRYRGLVESQNDLIVRVDANNRFTFVNKAYCETFGKSSKELIGRDFFPLIHEKDREATAKAMEKLYAPPYRCYLEQRAMTVKGWRWLAWEDNAILDNTGKIIEVQGVGRDITANKEKEEAIKKQAASLQNLLTHTPAVIYAYTFKDGLPDLHYINENVEQVLGFKPDDFLHNFDMWKSCVHPDDLKTLAEKLQKPEKTNLPSGETYNEYRFRDKNGNYRWLSDRQKSIVNSDGQIEVIGAWVDITNEKDKAEALHKYQSRLSLAQNFAKAGSWEYDIEKGALDWSPECEALFGLEKDNFEGSFEAFLERVHPDDRDYVIQTNAPIIELKEGLSLDYEHRIITPAGVTKWVKESAGIVKDESGKASHIIGLVMDITDQKLAEDAMENEKKLRDIVDNIDGIFWLRSADRQEMLYVSPAYEEIFGMSTGSLHENPESFTEAVHPEDSERINKAYETFIKTGVFKQEYRIRRPDGEIRWVNTRAFPVENDRGEVIRYAGITEDVTRRKLTEQSEREKTNHLNATIAALPDMLFFMSKDGIYLDVHTKEPEKLLTPKEKLIGRKISEFFNETETAKQLQLYKECVDEQALKTYDYSIELNGKTLYFEARLSPVDDQKLLAIVRDVSAQKLFVEDLQKAKLKAEEGDRMKVAFLATISHELRTPLNHIIGFSSLISDMTEEEETKSYADNIQQSGSAFLGMIEDIFDLAFIDETEVKLRNTTFKGMEFFMEAKNSLSELLQNAGKSDHINLGFNPDHALLQAYIQSDRQKIMMVLTHLFRNAVKFTSKGSIEFGMHASSETEIIFYVQDTGIGIEEDMQEEIFDFFRQVEDTHTRQHDGLGIGLSISKKIAETLQATLSLESSPDKGSTFIFKVPVTLNIIENQTGTLHRNSSSLMLEKQTILIAEDDTTSIWLLEKSLKDTQAKLIIAENGQQALELFRANPDINLVLMDLKMPVMDGYEATRQIKSLRPEIPVIALTAYALAKDKPKAFEAGCDAIVTKPVKKTELFKTIQDFLE